MCTISWFTENDQYHVFFNRDEQIGRSVAIPPEVFFSTELPRRIMPIDPQGGGTWCAVNEHGITIALLNFYQGRLPKGKLRSRGFIVKESANCNSIVDVEKFLRAQNLMKFAPFTLLCFTPDSETSLVSSFCWTGRNLETHNIASPLISSAVNFPKVRQLRTSVYEKALQGLERLTLPEKINVFNGLHQSHLPEKGAASICMHREDAQTVSFSHIAVTNTSIEFKYRSGNACQASKTTTVQMTRTY